MGLLTPAALALAVLLPVIIAMYLLKLRRSEEEVSSLYLWQRMVQDIEANAPWQKLKANLLLFLQLLIVAALVLALARPYTWGEGASGDLLIVVIDSSASMQASDVSPDRLEAARQEAGRLLDGITPSTRVIIIEAGDRAELRLAGSLDRAAMNRALNQIQPGSGRADLTTALELALAAAAGRPQTQIVVFTDGGAQVEGLASRYANIRFVVLGQGDNNQAIDLLTLERQPGGDFTAFVRVVNYASQPVSRRLTLLADGALINAFDLELNAGQADSVIAEGIPSNIVEARLVGEDSLTVDDHAWAVGGNQPPLRIALVSQGNLFLEAALSLMPGVEFSRIAPENYDPATEGGQPVAVTIFDEFVPSILPQSPMLFIGPSSSTQYFEVGATLDQPQPRVVDADHAVMRYVDFDQVEILDSPSLSLPPRGRVLIIGDGQQGSTPLLAVIEQDQVRVAVVAFGLRRSDLPLHTAFPVLLINLITWLAPGSTGALPDQVDAGQVVTYTPPPEAQSVTLVRPDGSQAGLDIVDGQVRIDDTAQTGLYRLESDTGQDDHFAVNLFAPEESNIQPGRLQAGTTGSSGSSAPDSERSRLEWWPWFAGTALLVLILEWLIYQRAAVARAAAWARGWWRRG